MKTEKNITITKEALIEENTPYGTIRTELNTETPHINIMNRKGGYENYMCDLLFR